MSATTPNLTPSNIHSSYNSLGHLAINTNTKRLYNRLDSCKFEGSSGLLPKKIPKSPNPINGTAILVSPPLKKGFSCLNPSSSPRIFIQNVQAVRGDKSSGLAASNSSSSQPNWTFHDFTSPNHHKFYHNEEIHDLEDPKSVFNRGFYKRIEEYLESEGLYLVDPGDNSRGDLRNMRKLKILGLKIDEQESGSNNVDIIHYDTTKSASESPRFLSNSLTSSQLFQRRLSRSQVPLKGINVLEEDEEENLPSCKKNIQRPNKRIRSPIIEKDTPISHKASSRGSIYNGNTPLSVKAFNFLSPFKRIMETEAVSKECSPEFIEKTRGSLTGKAAHSVQGKTKRFFNIQSEF